MKQIADLSLEDIIARKKRARHQLARLSFWEKVEIVEQMRERLAPFNAIRMRRKQAKAAHHRAA